MKSLKRPAHPAPAAATRPAPRPRALRALPAEIEAELAQIAAGAGCELIRAEWKGGVLRLVLDRPEGVTLGDCERVSKQASALLDVVDFGGAGEAGENRGGGNGAAGGAAGAGRGRYVLEVSSPGLDRLLDRPADYERFLGHLTRVTFLDAATRVTKLAEPSRPAGGGPADVAAAGATAGSGPRPAEALNPPNAPNPPNARKAKKTVVARLAEIHRADGSVAVAPAPPAAPAARPARPARDTATDQAASGIQEPQSARAVQDPQPAQEPEAALKAEADREPRVTAAASPAVLPALSAATREMLSLRPPIQPIQTVVLVEDGTGRRHVVGFEDILSARLEIEL